MVENDNLTELAELWNCLKRNVSFEKIKRALADPKRNAKGELTPGEFSLATDISTQLQFFGLVRVPSLLPQLPADLFEANDGVAVLDISGNFIWADPACCQIFELLQQDLLKANVFDLMNDSSIAKLISAYSSEILTRSRTLTLEFSLKSGRSFVARATEVILSASTQKRYGIMLQSSRRKGFNSESVGPILNRKIRM